MMIFTSLKSKRALRVKACYAQSRVSLWVYTCLCLLWLVLISNNLRAQSLGTGASALHSSVVAPDGTPYAWGYNIYGQLGVGNWNDYNWPQRVIFYGLEGKTIISIANGEKHTLALTSDGTVYTWGFGDKDPLDGDPEFSTWPNVYPEQVLGLTGVKAIAAGGDWHSVIIGANGKVYTWRGANTWEPEYRTPQEVPGLSGAKAIAAGYEHFLAIGADDKVYAWGEGSYGELGDGKFYPYFGGYPYERSTNPVQVQNLSGVKAVAAGSGFSLALGMDGKVYAWGRGENGQLGNDKIYNSDPYGSAVPVQVQGLADMKAISAGGGHSLALGADGKVYTWGEGRNGQLGNNRLYDVSPYGSAVPVVVQGLQGVKTIAAGSGHSLAYVTDGRLFAWGSGNALGDGVGRITAVPVQVSGLFTSQWNLRFGGSGADSFSQIIRTSDGGYLLGGSSNSGASGDKTQSGRGGYDYWIVKTDAFGNQQWNRRFGGSLDDNLFALIRTSDGGYLLGGSSASGISGDKTQSSRGGKDFWLVKISSTGSKQWDRRFGGTGSETAKELVQLSTGEYIVAGVSTSGAGGDKSQSSRGAQDYWIMKISSTGNKLWDRRFGGSGEESLEGLVRNADGSFLLAGFSSSGRGGDKTQAGRGLADYWIIKISSSGGRLWDLRYGGSSNDYLYALTPTTDGGYLLAGYSASGTGGDKTQSSRGLADYWVVKISSTGTKQWDRRFGGTGEDNLRAVVQTNDGGFLLGGRSLSGTGGDKVQSSRGNFDYWAVKLSGTGTKQWDKTFGSSGVDELKAVLQTSDGGYLLAGNSAPGAGGDRTQPSWGGHDYWMVKLSPSGGATATALAATTIAPVLDASITEVEEPEVVAYPNPFSEKVAIRLSFRQTQLLRLIVYDNQGRQVALLYNGEVKAGTPYEFEWRPTERQATGLYFLRLHSSANNSSHKIVLVR